MLSPDEIFELKKRYGKLYVANAAGATYVFRAITYKEYDDLFLNKEWSTVDIEDHLVQTVLLEPQHADTNQLPAGAVSQLAQEIRRVSGFSDARFMIDALNEKRNSATETREVMKAFILAAMPAYSEEDLDLLDFDRLSHKVALAEKILEIHQAVKESTTPVTLELVDPEEEEAKAARARQKHASSITPGQAGYDDPVARKLAEAMRNF